MSVSVLKTAVIDTPLQKTAATAGHRKTSRSVWSARALAPLLEWTTGYIEHNISQRFMQVQSGTNESNHLAVIRQDQTA